MKTVSIFILLVFEDPCVRIFFSNNCTGDWRGIVQLYENGFTDEKLLWFQPDSDGLNFLQKNLSELGVQGVSSIGCGSGLFEWLIKSSTGEKEHQFPFDVFLIQQQKKIPHILYRFAGNRL